MKVGFSNQLSTPNGTNDLTYSMWELTHIQQHNMLKQVKINPGEYEDAYQ